MNFVIKLLSKPNLVLLFEQEVDLLQLGFLWNKGYRRRVANLRPPVIHRQIIRRGTPASFFIKRISTRNVGEND